LKIAAICIVLVVFLSGCIFSGTEGSFQFSSPVIRKNGEVFVSTSDRIYSFASGSDSGKTIFSFEPGEGEWFSCAPSVDSDGNLYIGTTKGRLLKISPEGDLKWSFGGNEMEGASAIRGSPSFDQSGNVLYGAYDGALYCLSSDGQELWSFDTGREIWSKPAVGRDGTIYFGTMATGGQQSNRFYALKNGEARLFQLNIADGTLERSDHIGSDSLGSPVMSQEGALYYAVTLNDIGGRSRLGSLSTHSFPSGSWPMYGHDHNRSGRQESF